PGGGRELGPRARRGDVPPAAGQRRDRGLSVRGGTGDVRFGVAVFPGTWSDRDCGWVIDQVMGPEAELRYLWHKDRDLFGVDCVILPGGFSYGDYLRTGAIARFAPLMESVVTFAERGGLVWGICNGFQILCEAGLLP